MDGLALIHAQSHVSLDISSLFLFKSCYVNLDGTLKIVKEKLAYTSLKS